MQITDEHGSYEAVMQSNPVILNEHDIWSLHVERTRAAGLTFVFGSYIGGEVVALLGRLPL